ncbi:DUF2270 domain-containing protein [Halolamina sp.]|jgi:uncharacterized membrane protein|uniref:DUF2270 domain-containing protein n=1 Tax=Halolamina sp. TaxID=1940283 RepID=UPI000223C08B|nr:Uncharacterized conserved protein UCP01500 [halophilic archaeon DL31]
MADTVEAEEPDPAPSDVGKGLLDTEMGPSSAMAHLYRGEVHRMKLWRERLDRTTNWAVLVMAAIITWAFSSPDNPHYILLIGVGTLGVFLTIEARRYRGYEIWRSRVRTLQENVWAPGLDPSAGVVTKDWRERLSRDYRVPTLKISAEEAIAHRLRRVYLPLAAVLFGAWLVRITAFSPEPFPESAAVGMIPGTAVALTVALVAAAAIFVGCRPRTWHAKGELRAEELREQRS